MFQRSWNDLSCGAFWKWILVTAAADLFASRLKEGLGHYGKRSGMNSEKSTNRRMSGRRGSGADPLGANSEIGRKLRQYYDDLVKEEIPDRFSDLLSQLETQDQAQSTEKKA